MTDEWVYDGQNVVALSTDGVLAQEYLHTGPLDTPIALLDHAGGTAAYYYHTDALGTVRALTDATEAVAQAYTYTSFGVTTVGSPSGLDQPFRYTAREWDDASGLYYYRARYYDPHAGRFISHDPIRWAGGVNLYGYVANDPKNWIDPLGLSGLVWFAGAAALWGAGAVTGWSDGYSGSWGGAMSAALGTAGGFLVSGPAATIPAVIGWAGYGTGWGVGVANRREDRKRGVPLPPPPGSKEDSTGGSC